MIMNIQSDFILRQSILMERRGSCARPVSAAFGVGEGESHVSPTRCGQAVWHLHGRFLYGLGPGTAGVFAHT